MSASLALARAQHIRPDRSQVVPSADLPTVSVVGIGGSVAPTIASSNGWYREKRLSVAENTLPNSGGGGQSSANNLDVAGSTRFRYTGAGSPVAEPSSTGNYVRWDYEPGASAQAARWPAAIDFITNSPVVQIRINVTSATGRIGIITVNGLRTQIPLHLFASEVAAGSGAGITLTFGSSATRRIRVIGLNNNEGRFGGVAIQDALGYTISKPSAPGYTIAFVTDSYGRGAVNASTLESFIWPMGFRLGMEDIINASVGSTGYDAILSGQSTSNFQGRLAQVLSPDVPNMVVFAGGRNDSVDITTIAGTAYQTCIDAGVAARNIIVLPTCTNASARRTEMAAAAATKGCLFLPWNVDGYTKEADAVHYTLAEHLRAGNDAADLFYARRGKVAA